MIISQLKLGKKKRLIITFSTQIKKKNNQKADFFFLAASVNSGAESTCYCNRLIIGLYVSFRPTVAEHLL